MTLLKSRFFLLMFILIGAVAACTAQAPETIEVTREVEVTRVVEVEVEAEAPEWFAARQATAAYVDIAAAEADGFAPITDCMADAAKGAMGIHYANGALLEDPALAVAQPEVLMYQPLPDGRMELVGIEYLVPGSAWSENEPPTLLGQELAYLEELDLYALHLWAWRNNPDGLHADWNPNVSCSAAENAAATSSDQELPEWFAARQATEAYVNIAAAEADGFAPITDCMSDAEKGAMGIHYANSALLEDPALAVAQPEVLMYQPLSDGRMELVGVEYLVPGSAWNEDEPPTLLGQELEYLEDLDLYALHLWAWRNNPDGLYADWNPNLDCSEAETADASS